MASKNIKGITVEIGGNVTPLEKALKSVDASTKNLKSELGQINRLLKFDPKNATLLKQKYDVLEEQIKQTSEKLKTLKEAEKQAQSQFERGEISQEQYRGLQREVEQATQDLRRYERQLGEVERGLDNVGDAAEEASKDIDGINDASGGMAQQSGSNWAVVTTGISSAMNIAEQCFAVFQKAWDVGAQIGSAIGGFLKSSVEDTSEWRKDISKLEENARTAGTTFNDVSKELSYFIALTDEEDSSVEALSNLLKTGFKGQGLTAAVENLSGAVIQFPDTLKIESLADSLQETLATGKATGQFGELLERLGENLDTFNAGLAVCTTEAEKQQYAIDFLAKNGLADINEEYRKNNEDLIAYSESQTEYNTQLAKVGEAIQPTLTALEGIKAKVLEAALPAIETFSDTLAKTLADPAFQDAVSKMADAVGNVVQKFADWFSEAANSGALTDFINRMADKLPELADSIIKLIDALVGEDGGGGLFKAVETIADAIKGFLDFLSGAKDVVYGFKTMIEGLGDAFKKAAEQWRRFLNGTGNKKGFSTALNGNVQYFASGGIVTTPTNAIIGEAGSEAVIPLARLSGIMAAAMEKVGGNVVNGGNTYVMNVYPQDMTAGQQQALFNKFNRFIGQANGRSTI